MREDFTKINKIELRIYEIVGIRYFQKMVFALEKFIHRNDGGRNQNYHFTSNSIAPVDQFTKFLFFNGSIHVRNIIFFMLYCIIKCCFWRFAFYDVFLLILCIKDIYCVLLQRYNYLRMIKLSNNIRKQRDMRVNRKANQLLTIFKQKYDISCVEKDLEFVRNLKLAIINKSEIVLNVEDEIILQRLIEVMGDDN